jgi:hypothetical protein
MSHDVVGWSQRSARQKNRVLFKGNSLKAEILTNIFTNTIFRIRGQEHLVSGSLKIQER